MTIANSANQSHVALLSRLGGAVHPTPRVTTPDGRALEIGSFAGLPVWSAQLRPAECAPLAKRLAGMGRLGLLIVADDAHDRHLLTVTLAPVRVVAVPISDPAALALRRLASAAIAPSDTLLQQAVRFADALDIDAAGRRTFKLLHQLIEEGIAHLPHRIPRAERHSWLLTQLTRLLFLRFVEAEGWLNDNPRFLLHHFDRCLAAGRNPFRHFMQPLFFGTLNRPADQRLRVAREFGAIPFLNGGLFEPHPVEERHDYVLPFVFWENVFAAITERIEVTLDPTADAGEVTPEMLGRVFEGVMDADERKASGAFYTPSSLVRAMVKEALVPLLAQRTGRSESSLAASLDDPDTPLRQALLSIRVLDPAVGSGAFLVGALDLLHGPGSRQAGRVRHIVTRSLHGIDRHPGAVRITELRLWLEVLRSLRGATPQQVPPLPNLDASIRAGDALLDALHSGTMPRQASILAKQQRALANAHGAVKRQLLRELRESERDTMLQLLAEHESRLHRSITELVEAGQSQTLFGESAGLDAAERKRVAALRREWLETRRESRALARDATAVPFACAVAFAPIFAKQAGFDLVVGNPPWVRAERLPVATRRALGDRYRWWRGPAARGFQHQPDLAIAFVERSLELLRPGGTLALLLPAKLATTRYASIMREGLTRQTTLHCVADLADDSRAAFHATTYPMALVASRVPSQPDHSVRLSLDRAGPRVPQSHWEGASVWALNAPEAKQIAERLAAAHPPLRERIAPQLGVKTGANDLFLNPPAELSEWTRPIVRGRDISNHRNTKLDQLLWPADPRGNPWPRLPSAVSDYLTPHRRRLERRTDLHDSCWWRLFRTSAATAPHRVIWSDLARRLEAITLDDERVVPLNSCYVAVVRDASEARALSAWLNCRWIRAVARLNADPAAQGYARFNARAIGDLPLPPAVLRDPLLTEHRTHSDLIVSQTLIDDHTAQMLQLSREDRELLSTMAPDRR